MLNSEEVLNKIRLALNKIKEAVSKVKRGGLFFISVF